LQQLATRSAAGTQHLLPLLLMLLLLAHTHLPPLAD